MVISCAWGWGWVVVTCVSGCAGSTWSQSTCVVAVVTFALLAQVTIPQTTEGGETWPKDTSDLTAGTTTPVQQATQAHPQIGMDTGECKNAQPADVKVTTQETAELNRTMNSGAPRASVEMTSLSPYLCSHVHFLVQNIFLILDSVN